MHHSVVLLVTGIPEKTENWCHNDSFGLLIVTSKEIDQGVMDTSLFSICDRDTFSSSFFFLGFQYCWNNRFGIRCTSAK